MLLCVWIPNWWSCLSMRGWLWSMGEICIGIQAHYCDYESKRFQFCQISHHTLCSLDFKYPYVLTYLTIHNNEGCCKTLFLTKKFYCAICHGTNAWIVVSFRLLSLKHHLLLCWKMGFQGLSILKVISGMSLVLYLCFNNSIICAW
jgi:hypothetical protein